MQLSIIFVNWNSTEYLRQCLTSIYEFAPTAEFEIIIVDNASADADVHLLKQQFKHIILIQSLQNLGFGRANNLGFKQSTGKYLLFLNPDTQLLGPATDVMLTHMESLGDAGIVGCKLLNTDLSIQTSCIQTFPTILNQALDFDFLRERWPHSRFWGTGPLVSESTAPAKVEVISGACMMIRRDVFERIGMFSDEYFMYAEDLDLCRKAVQANYTNYYIGDARIIHHGGKSSSPSTATVAKWQSMVQYFVKNHGYSHALLFRAVMSIVAVFRLALLALGISGRSVPENSPSGYSPTSKWKAILRTLLMGSHPVEPGTRHSA